MVIQMLGFPALALIYSMFLYSEYLAPFNMCITFNARQSVDVKYTCTRGNKGKQGTFLESGA